MRIKCNPFVNAGVGECVGQAGDAPGEGEAAASTSVQERRSGDSAAGGVTCLRDRDRFDADGSGNALAAAARGIAERGGEAHEREGVLGRGPARGGSGDLRLRAAAEGSDEAGVLLR